MEYWLYFLRFMKKFSLHIINLFLFLFLTSSSYAESLAPATVAFIDQEKIYTESKAAKDINRQVLVLKEKFELELKEVESKLKKEEEELKKQQNILESAVFIEKLERFEEKVAEFQILRQQKVVNLDNVVNYGRKKILDKLTQIIGDIANEREINIVLEKRLILVGASSLEITNDVLKSLDAEISTIELPLSEIIN